MVRLDDPGRWLSRQLQVQFVEKHLVIFLALPAGPPNLSTTVRWWFDSGVAIRYQLVYSINQPNGISCTP